MQYSTQDHREVRPSVKASSLSEAVKFLAYHARTAYLLSCNNINDIIVTGYFFGALNATIAPKFSMGPSQSLGHILEATPGMLLWSWSNLALFNLHNQRHGIDEDAMNKPWRPLPSKRLTPDQATRAMYCLYPIILLVSLRYGGLVPCLVEAISCIHYNELGGSSNSFLKNFLNGVGFASFLAGPFEIATGHSVLQTTPMIWLLFIVAAITTVSHLQDFRDMEGDKKAGRNTVPLIVGDTNARVLVAVGLFVWTCGACWFWNATLSGILASVMGVGITANLFWDRSQAGDIMSWKLFPFWLLGLMMIPLSMD